MAFDADVVLVSHGGVLLPVPSTTLRTTSAWFRTMFTLPQGFPPTSRSRDIKPRDTVSSTVIDTEITSLDQDLRARYLLTCFRSNLNDMKSRPAVLRPRTPNLLALFELHHERCKRSISASPPSRRSSLTHSSATRQAARVAAPRYRTSSGVSCGR